MALLPFPVTFHLGNIAFPAHLLFEILAYFTGFRLYLTLGAQSTDFLTSRRRGWVMAGGILGAAIGSKLLGLLEHPALFHLSLIYFMSSKTIVGGLLGGLIGVEAAKKMMGISHSTGDLFCFPLIIGMMIGRIGCFLAGVTDGTHGIATDSFLGMDLGDGIPRHPTALYEIFVLAAIGLFLRHLQKRATLAPGSLFKLFMCFYLFWRFLVEFIKPVEPLPYLGISAIQLACLLGLFYYRKVLFRPSSQVRL